MHMGWPSFILAYRSNTYSPHLLHLTLANEPFGLLKVKSGSFSTLNSSSSDASNTLVTTFSVTSAGMSEGSIPFLR